LPQKLGTSLSVVGAPVIGQAVVAAGLVSWPVVAVVAITAIANFAIPRWSMALAVRFLRFGEMMVAAAFGLPGVLVVTVGILVHLVGLRSFGLPYFYPVAPLDPEGLGDALIRMPHWAPHQRERLLAPRWLMRVRPGRRPRAPRHSGTKGTDPRTTRRQRRVKGV
jgi:spore germination protein KA